MKTVLPIRLGLAMLIASAAALAQPVVAPTPGAPDEIQDAGGYTISNSFEAGYRSSSVAGNHDAYRAGVNFGSGIRLLETTMRIHSQQGKGTLIDELSFHTAGQGGDPYQFSRLRVEKNRWFRYDMTLRVNQFFNQLPSLWSGERAVRSERTFQNHDLTLFPGARLEVLLGYDRNTQSGPGFTTEGVDRSFGGFERSNFLRLANDLRRANNQYRAGVNFRLAGLAVTFLQALDNYKEDTSFRDGAPYPSISPNIQAVSSLRRDEPIHGNTPVTTVAIRTENEHKLGFQARYVYASGNRGFVLSEDLTAFNPGSGLSSNRQTFVFGDARRKQASGEATVTFMPNEKLTLSNTTAFNNTRISGDASFLEVTSFSNQFAQFEHLGIRHLTNASEINFRPRPKIGLYGAYRFSRRRIETRDSFTFGSNTFRSPLATQDNDIHSGVAGFRWRPAPAWRISFDTEIGRADLPFTPRSDRKFHSETVRMQWRRKGFRLSGRLKSRENNNSASLINHSSTSRYYSLSGSWARPSGRFSIDGGYTKLELDTVSGIFNFFGGPSGQPSQSFYTSNLHTAYISTRIQPRARLTLYLGYNIVKDTGEGRDSLVFADDLEPAYPNFRFDGVNFFNSFPLTYQSPSARLSVSLHQRLSWNFGWQYYGYSERFSGTQNYHAHVSYSSLRWSF